MKKIKMLFCGMLILILAFAMIGCASSTNEGTDTPETTAPPSSNDPDPNTNTVYIKDYKYQPGEITIDTGETITWINEDSVGHNVAADTFECDILQKGESFSYTFNETGTFDYICTPHPFMKGKVIVN
ncbi:MAG: cupredoxin domain-containing protein [Dehalobacterium sp.]